ncbi:NUDIX hydrolase [Actinophytocola sp.]|uniref:NUDIX hydrolase n=1 Tax=Actinophytocola sp. TaxID=1872138 RepID=UPI002D808439|nr:NUDIX hydrolase [Actinophytocola sp.]HET9141736.1 NUDIX hydrolase [Actinophytocola sp.]
MTLVITTLAVVIVLILAGWLMRTANRLDRLHVRTDAAWAALDAALARRAVVARAVAAAGLLDQRGADTLRVAAERAEQSARMDREATENDLTLQLAAVDRAHLPLALATELVDAEQRVVIARRVHNDAVRDTLAQRRRRAARWLKLAGNAPRPEYFEIVEPALAGEPDAAPMPRPAARVVLLDDAGRVLLFNGHDPRRAGESWWFTVGGGVEPGENLRTAAARELAEETGIVLPDDELVGPMWRRRVVFSFDGRTYDGEEWFFLASLPPANGTPAEPQVSTAGFTDVERRVVDGHRWWSAEELRSTRETVYPVQLGELLPELRTTPWDGTVRTVR